MARFAATQSDRASKSRRPPGERRRAPSRGRPPAAAIVAAIVGLVPAGCGYTVGNGFSEQVRSVHVPIFKADTNRRGLEYQLTEAVQKEIQNRSHFRLAKPPYADTELRGRIVDVRKAVLGETAFDDPRSLQVTYAVEVSWVDLRSGQILSQQRIPIAPDLVQLLATADYAPEVGQSLATATHESSQKMARSIVDMMEAPW